ncbi:MAG TPA: NAD(P)H-binding protein [Solirubrobacteraceae bacterium]|nr:NAD(P)H-binding protein [Solirubrobacteraceae bacterium]
MARRIIIFGATGFTGRLVAERLAAQGAAPVVAGRSESSVRELAERLGTEWALADALRRNSVFALLERGDVLVSTVGPFAKWGEPAVRAAIAAHGTYIDSTGEPTFIKRVFEEFGPPAERAGATLLTAMGYDYVPGTLAGALALREAGEAAVRVDVGYYAFGIQPSAGTRRSGVGIMFDTQYAFRDGALRDARIAERVRSFHAKGKDRNAVSIGASEQFTLPPVYPGLREVNVYLGWFGALARPIQAGSLAGAVAMKAPGARSVFKALGDRFVEFGGSGPERPGSGLSWIVGEAYDAGGTKLTEVHLSGPEPYDMTAGIIAWAAQQDPSGVGAVGPVQAYGLDALEEGCREAGLTRVVD